MEKTTIEISVENWQWLTSQKQRPGESFNDVLNQLREQHDADPSPVEIDTNVDTAEGENDGVAPRTDDDVAATDAAAETDADSLPESLDIPGSGETYERRRQAIARLYTHLKREGTASRADFLELINPDDLDYASERSFWTNCVKGRDNLCILPGVQPPGEGEHTWRYSD